MPPLRVLALQPWDAGSHKAVRLAIDRYSRNHWKWLTLPGRSPRWRLRHSGLRFAQQAIELIRAGDQFDAIFATGLCSLADFRAAAPPEIRNLPHVLYMHENQAAYPISETVDPRTIDRDTHLSFTNMSSIEAADKVLWNSQFNRESFVEQMSIILRRAPESVNSAWVNRLQDKSEVAWPPVEPIDMDEAVLHNVKKGRYQDAGESGRRIVRVAWPHRWEHDKGCDEFLAVIEQTRDDPKLEIRWTILGQQFERMPAAMHVILGKHADCLDHAGRVEDRAGYLKLLGACDWVFSTSRHEFFGIAVVEAMLLGCLPWLPDRLSYPELVPQEYQGMDPWHPPDHPDIVREAIAQHLAPSLAPNAVGRIDDAIERTGPA